MWRRLKENHLVAYEVIQWIPLALALSALVRAGRQRVYAQVRSDYRTP